MSHLPSPTPLPPSRSIVSVLTLAHGSLFPVPPSAANVDPTKADAIRRTIYVGNVPQAATEEQLISFFTPCGSVKFVRIQGDPTAPTK